MKKSRLPGIHFFYLMVSLSINGCQQNKLKPMTEKEFEDVLVKIAHGWNNADATLAIGYFDKDAVYEEPPGNQLYKGTIELFEFFGGEKGHEIPMKMEWHNTAFNAAAQTGFGEYTFEMNNKYHGIVIMKFENRKIIKWREYQYKSDLDWNDFAKETYFKTSD